MIALNKDCLSGSPEIILFVISISQIGTRLKCEIGSSTCELLCERMTKPISGHHYTASDRAMFAAHPGGWYAALTVARLVVTDDHGEARYVTAVPGVVGLPLSLPSLLLSI